LVALAIAVRRTMAQSVLIETDLTLGFSWLSLDMCG
jgi:hypothetical protein